MKKVLNQKGFGAAGIIIIVLVLLAVGGVGYYVFSKHKDSNKADTAPASTTSSNDNSTASSTPKYLDIAELGIKIKLDSRVEDAVYAKATDGRVYLSTKALMAGNPACDPAIITSGSGGWGSIYIFTDPKAPDPFTGNYTNATEFPDAAHIGDKYYSIVKHQYSCLADKYDEFKSASDDAYAGFPKSTIEAL